MTAQEVETEVKRILEMFMDGIITAEDAANMTSVTYGNYKE